MAKKKGKRGTATHSTSVLTALFAADPALFILTNTPAGSPASPLGSFFATGGASWGSIQNAGWALYQNIAQNWVGLLVVVLIVFVVVKVLKHAGHPKITRHLRM